ncbi:MAG: hypothetical protein AB1791_06005, partial [Chloroflexota bacterium]
MNMQLTLAARYMAGRRTRTFLTTLAIIFGVMLIFGLNSMVPAFIESIRQNMLAAAGTVDLAVTSVGNSAFDSRLLETLRSIEGISQASGSLRRNLLLPAGAPVGGFTVAGL